MSANLRVHIAPVGFEYKRITNPLIDMLADKVYFVRLDEDDDPKGYFRKILNELKTSYPHIKVENLFMDMWDLEECIEKLRAVFQKENAAGNRVYFNVSTGTKVTAIAGMTCCMLWGGTPYYAKVDYKDESEHVNDRYELPVYDIRKPDDEFMIVLNLLQEAGGTTRKAHLISKLEDLKIIKLKDDKKHELSESAKHSQLRSILEPMERDWKFVKVDASGRRSEVTITDQGRIALRIFGMPKQSGTT